MMNATAEILKAKIENFSPETLEALSRIVENFEVKNQQAIPQIQLDEVLYRIQFHHENPMTKLDFYEHVSELQKNNA
jgi:hypothetical protein